MELMRIDDVILSENRRERFVMRLLFVSMESTTPSCLGIHSCICAFIDHHRIQTCDYTPMTRVVVRHCVMPMMINIWIEEREMLFVSKHSPQSQCICDERVDTREMTLIYTTWKTYNCGIYCNKCSLLTINCSIKRYYTTYSSSATDRPKRRRRPTAARWRYLIQWCWQTDRHQTCTNSICMCVHRAPMHSSHRWWQLFMASKSITKRRRRLILLIRQTTTLCKRNGESNESFCV